MTFSKPQVLLLSALMVAVAATVMPFSGNPANSTPSYGEKADDSGAAYLAGVTSSSNFSTLNPCQLTYQANTDAFVTKLPGFICSDADGSETIDALDITYLINFLYKHGPAPNCP